MHLSKLASKIFMPRDYFLLAARSAGVLGRNLPLESPEAELHEGHVGLRLG